MRIDRSNLFAVATFVVLGTFGCNPGSYDSGGRGGTREAALGQVCEASLSLTGTFTPGAAQPADMFGCWPVGQWKVRAQVTGNGCGQPPALESEYVFEVSRNVEERFQYRYVNDPAWEKVKMKTSSGGGGLCEGGFEVFSADGKSIVRLKPSLEADGTISGFGEYEVYTTAQI